MTPDAGDLAGRADADEIAIREAVAAANMTFNIGFPLWFSSWRPEARTLGSRLGK